MPDPNRLSASDPQQIGAYRLAGVLGEGGQGTVYLGQTSSGRRVAVKVLHTRMAAEASVRERFEREAALARRVAVFCTAQVLEAGVSDGRPYLVSEYVPGPSLQQLVAGEGPRTGSGLERLAVATATALAAIHRVGIVHRDFKPANVIMGPEGPVVIDFGIARILEAGVTSSALVGSPGYMAPEQLSDQPAGPAADMFAWAATMVYAATGHAVFTGQHPAAVMNAVLRGVPDLTGVPDGLRPLLAACLAKDPAARPTAERALSTLTGHGNAPIPLNGNGSQTVGRTVPGVVRQPPYGQGSKASDRTLGNRGSAVPGPSDGGDVEDDVTRYGFSGKRSWDVSAQPDALTVPAHPHLSPPPQPAMNHAGARTPVPDRDIAAGVPRGTTVAGAAAPFVPAAPPHRRSRLLWGVVAAAIVVTAAALIAVIVFPSHIPFLGTETSTAPSTAAASTPTPSVEPSSSRALFTGHARAVNAVAVTELDGRSVVVSGSGDQTVRVWDLATGKQLGQPITDPAGPIVALAVTELDGRPTVVSGGYGETMRIWDLTTGKQLGQPIKNSSVESLAVTELDGRPVVISGSQDETVRLWDLATGKQLGQPFEGHSGTISGLAVTELDGRPTVVSGSIDKTARVWDPTTGEQVRQPLTDSSISLNAVTVAELNDQPVAITGGGVLDRESAVWVWDLVTGSPIGQPFKGHTDEVRSVAVTQLEGRPVVISGSLDKTVRIWDLATREPIGKPLTGHDRGIHSIAVTKLDGRPVIVTGSGDGTIRVWDLPTSSGGN
ncbi:protein kinase [Planomonospora sp. ID91781]|uniref:WD40 repeat domain-containing serine/threonine protein kinase n=1 Tax=Planomonospora sp. ID91781 TaxID=2738135 RepID=UPI0018C3BAC1|nr:serine/threonine-protein kinase [Planomonospora sp. ID91781]MBG0820856.1 protein kinase [Planomonospora sp. ID91781]